MTFIHFRAIFLVSKSTFKQFYMRSLHGRFESHDPYKDDELQEKSVINRFFQGKMTIFAPVTDIKSLTTQRRLC